MTDQTSPAKGLTSEELDAFERRVNDPRTWSLSLELSEARALNSREPWPIYLTVVYRSDFEISVFDEHGQLSAEMKAFIRG